MYNKIIVSIIGSILPVAVYYLAQGYIYTYNMVTSFAQRKAGESANLLLDKAGLVIEPKQHHIPSLISFAAKSYRLHPELLAALIHQESRTNPNAISPKGAIGLTQIMPFNAKRCGHTDASDLWNKRNNVMCGAKILSEELKTYKGDLTKALQAYNGGPKCIDKCAESLNYSKSIIQDFAFRLVRSEQT